MATSTVKDFLVTHLMPEKCYERIVVNLHVHAQAVQLLTILWRRSAEGLSLASVLLQLYAFSCPVVYAAANNFPFLYVFKHIDLLPVLQVRTNHCNGHTGQLATLSVFLSCAGSLGIFVSLQETESLFTTLSHALSAGLSFVLLVQVLCSSGTTKAKIVPATGNNRRLSLRNTPDVSLRSPGSREHISLVSFGSHRAFIKRGRVEPTRSEPNEVPIFLVLSALLVHFAQFIPEEQR
ncbi:Mannose-P-dolichol utilization defect 1 protein [Liparis tanakae]|uniref:Mannose-P-dolichol utilization defect 1 protein n=1 Tax=Liparis tanakae TaxID=230148 RepID=A0A4Z2I5B0_9TELE|nr:Mannose-P-dolichol utilization defect 1 protein [Liparis tanakae]